MDRDLSRQLARDPRLRFDLCSDSGMLGTSNHTCGASRRRMGAVCLTVPQLAPIFRTHLNKSHPPTDSHSLGQIVDLPYPPQSRLGLSSPFHPCLLDLIAYPKAPHDLEREMHASKVLINRASSVLQFILLTEKPGYHLVMDLYRHRLVLTLSGPAAHFRRHGSSQDAPGHNCVYPETGTVLSLPHHLFSPATVLMFVSTENK